MAQIGSAAVAKVIRQRNLHFIAVTCHEDVEPWLQPDWLYRPAEQAFAWRSLRRRPAVELEIGRCSSAAWPTFAPHHYLSHSLNPSAVCFLATIRDQPVAFSAWLPFVGSGSPARREHRTVCLPDFQGIGIGNAVSALVASLWKALGYRALSTTTHPAMIRSHLASPDWRMTRRPSLAGVSEGNFKHATTRLTTGFEHIGPATQPLLAKTLIRHANQTPPNHPTNSNEIAAFVRAGGFSHVAAEAAGTPWGVFEQWMQKGSAKKAKPHFRNFYEAVTQAKAQARLGAEMQALKTDPVAWLKFGPGKETKDTPGWSTTVKPRITHDHRTVNFLMHPEMMALLSSILQILARFPEARSAVAKALASAPKHDSRL